MKRPAFDLSLFHSMSDPESRRLWQKYQLSITPKFFAVLALLLTIATVRNLVEAEPFMTSVIMALLCSATTAAGYWKQEWFFRLTRLTSLSFIPLVLWSYFGWPRDYPAPTLILLPVSVLYILFADHLVASTVFLLFACGLLIYSALNLPAGNPEELELVLAFGITTGMLYVGATLLWFLLHSLFKSRAELSEALEKSLTLRQSLLTIFFDKLSPPLGRLEQYLRRDKVEWPELARIVDEIKAVLDHARDITLTLSSKLGSSSQNEMELEFVRNKVWMYLLGSGFVSCLLIIAAALAGPLSVSFPEIGIALILALLLWLGNKQPVSAKIRLAAIYAFTGFIAMACGQSLLDQQPPYDILYFYIIIFSTVFIGGPLHAGITTMIAALFTGLWYGLFPSLDTVPSFMRSNIVMGLIFMLAFSCIVWVWLKRTLLEISERDNQLRIETDTRHRLMATLFHDIANPLFIIQANAELAQDPDICATDLLLMRSLTGKIQGLVAFTREFEEMEKSGGTLPVTKVALDDLLDDLEVTYKLMLASKQLELKIEKNASPVLAHESILGMSVLSNLLTNAIKFSPRGGKITISTDKLAGGLLMIKVQDEGGGLPAEVVRRLENGEPVKSTKGTAGESGDGQGLRLASLYLNRMNGKLIVDTSSVIAVILPLAL